jgi:hypothetical protein
MSGNDAVRAPVKMVMGDRGDPVPIPDGIVSAIVHQVLCSIGLAGVGEEHGGPSVVRRQEAQLGSTMALIARETTRAAQKVEVLDALADAAVAYRKSVRKGKGEKSARAKLFEAVAARKASS